MLFGKSILNYLRVRGDVELIMVMFLDFYSWIVFFVMGVFLCLGLGVIVFVGIGGLRDVLMGIGGFFEL